MIEVCSNRQFLKFKTSCRALKAHCKIERQAIKFYSPWSLDILSSPVSASKTYTWSVRSERKSQGRASSWQKQQLTDMTLLSWPIGHRWKQREIRLRDAVYRSTTEHSLRGGADIQSEKRSFDISTERKYCQVTKSLLNNKRAFKSSCILYPVKHPSSRGSQLRDFLFGMMFSVAHLQKPKGGGGCWNLNFVACKHPKYWLVSQQKVLIQEKKTYLLAMVLLLILPVAGQFRSWAPPTENHLWSPMEPRCFSLWQSKTQHLG